MTMPALLPIFLTASHIVLATDSVPKFDVERTCRAAGVSGLPGRRHASETSKTRAANLREPGANTAQHSEASAPALLQPVAQQVM
jgi:hypothetical protein